MTRKPKTPSTPLVTIRKKIEISNSSRANDDFPSQPNQTRLKMAKKLEPIKDLVALLSKPLYKETSEFAASLLSKAIEVRHCNKREKYYRSNPDVDPNPIGFKFKLTCKLEYVDNATFKTQAAVAAKIMIEAKKSLREYMLCVMKIENKGVRLKVQNNFIEGLL